ncbi:hypothetical protein [Microcystis aeruginosa]|uniref:Uncharacterized protein n=1 Tax=Microcystis aeruginosa PCC 9808 TaxID=1160284 RepID=I4HKG4_MICAE|nr:hypothetical protein [Microcystis aeruginosa]CCI22538.1 membrane hypothetical protein [Microcystis aeruginosa PCC 9808]
MCFFQSGNSTIVITPNRESWEAAVAGSGYLLFWATIIFVVTAPIWLPFVFLQNRFEYLINQWKYDGWIIDPITRFIFLSVGLILVYTIYIFVIIPTLIIIFDFCNCLFRKAKIQILHLFRQPIAVNQRRYKLLIKNKSLIRTLILAWIVSLLVLPLTAFCTQIGIQYLWGTITRSYAENVEFHKFQQNPFDQLKLLDLQKKYSLHLKPEEREFMLGSTIYYDLQPQGVKTSLGLRSSLVLFYDLFKRLEDKYNVKFQINEKVRFKLAKDLVFEDRILGRNPKIDVGKISDSEVLNYLEYSFISEVLGLAKDTIKEVHEPDIIDKISDSEMLNYLEYSLILNIATKKYSISDRYFYRNSALELTRLWKHNLSNEQKKVSYEPYCHAVVNSIYIAYRQESGYLPSKNDSKMINSEAKNPKGDRDFNDCRKFLLNKGYQFIDGPYNYFYKP